jgi:hypothetical protein
MAGSDEGLPAETQEPLAQRGVVLTGSNLDKLAAIETLVSALPKAKDGCHLHLISVAKNDGDGARRRSPAVHIGTILRVVTKVDAVLGSVVVTELVGDALPLGSW